MLAALIASTVLVALAELGDKTQLLALVLAARYNPYKVLLGITIATLLVHLLSTAAGALIGHLIPAGLLAWVTGVLFIGFGIWTLRGDRLDDEDARSESRYGPVLTSGIAFFLAELGDKTQIMTMSIAADPGAALRSLGSFAHSPALEHAAGVSPQYLVLLGVWMGSTLGMVLADGIAIVVGAVLGRQLPERLITRIAGVAFILFGLAAIAAHLLRGA